MTGPGDSACVKVGLKAAITKSRQQVRIVGFMGVWFLPYVGARYVQSVTIKTTGKTKTFKKIMFTKSGRTFTICEQ